MIYVNARALIERQHNNATELLIQIRNKDNQSECYELPGGQINKYESLFTALKREVFEETGLVITEIEGESDHVNTSDMGYSFSMECIKPFAVYQTLKGPVDSMGVYFRCKAKGNLLKIGDCTKNAHWASMNELTSLINGDRLFSDIDRAAVLLYLKECN